MGFYNYYENEVLEDTRHWLEENVTFVSELMDKYTDEDGYRYGSSGMGYRRRATN